MPELAIFPVGFGVGMFLSGGTMTIVGYIRLLRWSWTEKIPLSNEVGFLFGFGIFMSIVGLVAVAMWGPTVISLVKGG